MWKYATFSLLTIYDSGAQYKIVLPTQYQDRVLQTTKNANKCYRFHSVFSCSHRLLLFGFSISCVIFPFSVYIYHIYLQSNTTQRLTSFYSSTSWFFLWLFLCILYAESIIINASRFTSASATALVAIFSLGYNLCDASTLYWKEIFSILLRCFHFHFTGSVELGFFLYHLWTGYNIMGKYLKRSDILN